MQKPDSNATLEQYAAYYADKRPGRLSATHPLLFADLLARTSFLTDVPDNAVTQRLWHVNNNKYCLPVCRTCGNSVKWDPTNRTYREYCSVACSNTPTLDNAAEWDSTTEAALLTLSNKELRTLPKQNKRIYGALINHTNYLPVSASLMQRMWHVRNNTQANPGCKACGKDVKWDGSLGNAAYRTFCSNKCSANDDGTKSKYIHKSSVLYGTQHPNQRNIPTEVLEQLQNKDWLEYQHYDLCKPFTQIAMELNVDATTITNYCNKHGIAHKWVRPSSSREEQELVDYVRTLTGNVLTNDRTVIHPLELDVYLPEHSLAIEMCGCYWHSDRFKPTNYHNDKYQRCLDAGIQLLTIYDVEWNTKQDIVKSIIAYKLGLATNRVSARRCLIQVPSVEQQKAFFNANHIQGWVHSSFCWMLTQQNVPVAMMAFTKRQDRYELVRYATQLSTSVRGGFTKLLNEATKTITTSIISFADKRWSDGDLYRMLFTEVTDVKPTYNYVSYKNKFGEMFHRSSFSKRNLARKLSTYDETKTEFENCDDNNLYRIWDCGKTKFILTQ